MLDIIFYKPMGWLLKTFSEITGGNYLFAILIFALVVEIALLPFGIFQQKNSIKQAKLRPKEMAIRKKYEGRTDTESKQKMETEVREFYQKEGYNPLSGCLPLLIQFPLLIGLYNVVVNPLKYICGLGDAAISQIGSVLGRTATTNQTMIFLGEMKDKGYGAFKHVEGFSEEMFNSMPSLKVFGAFDLSVSPKDCMNLDALKEPSAWLIVAIPVLTFLAYFFSMKLSRKFSYNPMNDANNAQAGCSNKMMDITMPLFSVFISFTYPAALGIYWIVKSILGVVKQFALSRLMPLPKFTEEDYKAALREMNVKNEKNTKVAKSGRVVRSLHHIDDEDFEDTAEAGRRRREALEAQEAERLAEKTKTKFSVAPAPIKDDGNSDAEEKDKK